MKDRSNKEEPKKFSFLRRFIGFMFNLFMLCCVVIAGYVLIIFLRMPSLDFVLNETRPAAVVFFDKNGNEIRSTNQIMGNPVSVNGVPDYVWQSIVAIEDKRFFKHGPFDVKSTMRALFHNIANKTVSVGGSSITQQTAKNIFLTREKTLTRKVQELILSYWLESRFDKKQILDLYMNRVSLVGGKRGIDAAANMLFQVSANNLSLAQAVQIAAMLKAPTTYSPLFYPEKNIARSKIILQEMVKQGYITIEQAKSASQELRAAKLDTNTNNYRYWTDFVYDELNSRLGNWNTDIYVYTTLDTGLQTKITNILPSIVRPYQTAVVAMDYDGAIRSMIGGVDYQTSQFNRALAYRQPGSAFKPVVYLVALEQGMTPDTIVNDSKFTIGDYKPENYNERYYGDITLKSAFAKSVNSVPLKLAETYGINSVLNMASRLGVGNRLPKEYSMVLGASEISLLDLTSMYTVIWNGGQSVIPYSITRITDGKGQVLYTRNPSEPIQILSNQTVEYMQELLHDVVETGGTGHRAYVPGVKGGKTGTSNENRDAWFVGATQDTILGVWVGNDDDSPMQDNVTGGTIPAEAFKTIIE